MQVNRKQLNDPDGDLLPSETIKIKTASGVKVELEDVYKHEAVDHFDKDGNKLSVVHRDDETTTAGVHLTKESSWVFVGFPKGSKINGVYIHGDGSFHF